MDGKELSDDETALIKAMRGYYIAVTIVLIVGLLTTVISIGAEVRNPLALLPTLVLLVGISILAGGISMIALRNLHQKYILEMLLQNGKVSPEFYSRMIASIETSGARAKAH